MKQQKTQISVIMPVYNTELEMLKKAISCILKQSFSDFELIIIDDGSEQKVVNFLDEFEKIDERIKIIHQKNQGVSSARNRGLAMANGQFIVFMDSDDETSENYLAALYQAVIVEQEIDYAVCGIEFVGKRIASHPEKILEGREKIHFLILDQLRDNLNSGPCCKIYRKSVLEQYQIKFDQDCQFGEDLIFNIQQISRARKIHVIPEVLYTYEAKKSGLAFRMAGNLKYRRKIIKELSKVIGQGRLMDGLIFLMVSFKMILSMLRAKIRIMRSSNA